MVYVKGFLLLIFAVTMLIPIAQSQDTSCGIIWYPAIQLGDSSDGGYSPRIALSGEDTVHVTWWQDVPPGKRLPYARSVVKNVFEPVRDLITDTITFRFQAYTPFILADNNIVRVVFAYPQTTTWPYYTPLWMISSSNFGETWSNVQNISSQRAGRLLNATMRRDTIAIIYPPDTTDRLLRSSTGGQTWSQTDENLFPTPGIALTSRALHLVKNTAYGGHAEILYKRSSNLGNSWNFSKIISDADEYWSDIPTIAGSTSECGTELLTAWRDDKYGNYGIAGGSIISRAALRNGNLWLPENCLTTEPKGTEPKVALRENIRAVGWAHEKYFMEFNGYIRVTNNSLLNYCPIYNLTPPYTEDGDPRAIAVSSHAVHVVSLHYIGNTWRVFYRRGEFIPSNVSFSLSTSSLEMDTTEIGRTITNTVSVLNTGSDTMIVGTAISDNENFYVTPYDTTIAPFDEVVFTVNFTPKSYGTHTGKIIFYHNGRTSPDCFDVTGTATWRKETISYQQGEWNMVSIPMKPGPVQSLPSMFSYEGSYVPRDTMLFGKGYWSKPAAEVIYYGADVWSDTFAVRSGWNMIGSLTGDVLKSDITTIPDNIITSLFYMFDGEKYVSADTLKPGRAYWIKVKQDGKVLLRSP